MFNYSTAIARHALPPPHATTLPREAARAPLFVNGPRIVQKRSGVILGALSALFVGDPHPAPSTARKIVALRPADPLTQAEGRVRHRLGDQRLR